jgi:prepilin-type N-terminal cleavage/methylation domain-containing protein
MRRHQAGITLIELLLVMAIISLMAGIGYPSLSRGIDSLRMRTATDSLAAFLNSAVSRVDRLQQPVEISFSTGGRRLELRGLQPRVLDALDLPQGVTIADFAPPLPGLEPGFRFLVLQPGSPFPAVGFQIENRRGARRIVRIDPVAGVPVILAP